jgi:hypothetical protein
MCQSLGSSLDLKTTGTLGSKAEKHPTNSSIYWIGSNVSVERIFNCKRKKNNQLCDSFQKRKKWVAHKGKIQSGKDGRIKENNCRNGAGGWSDPQQRGSYRKDHRHHNQPQRSVEESQEGLPASAKLLRYMRDER